MPKANKQMQLTTPCGRRKLLIKCVLLLLFLPLGRLRGGPVLTGERSVNKQTADGMGYLNNTKASKW